MGWSRSAARVQKVQKVQKVQRMVVAADAAGCVEGLRRFRSGGNGPSGRGFWIALRAILIKSALRDDLAGPYGMISIPVIGSLRSPPPIRLRRTSPCSGGRTTCA